MCIMQVRPGQRHSTIAQACAHNTDTILGDLEMFCALLEKRGHADEAAAARSAQAQLQGAYTILLAQFVDFASAEPHLDVPVGSERELAEVVHHDAELARRFMTR